MLVALLIIKPWRLKLLGENDMSGPDHESSRRIDDEILRVLKIVCYEILLC